MHGIPSDVFCNYNCSPSPVAEEETINEKDDGGISERVLSFVVEFRDILLPVIKKKSGWITSQLVDLPTDTLFKMNILEQYIKRFIDCKDVTAKNKREPKKNVGLHRILV